MRPGQRFPSWGFCCIAGKKFFGVASASPAAPIPLTAPTTFVDGFPLKSHLRYPTNIVKGMFPTKPRNLAVRRENTPEPQGNNTSLSLFLFCTWLNIFSVNTFIRYRPREPELLGRVS